MSIVVKKCNHSKQQKAKLSTFLDSNKVSFALLTATALLVSCQRLFPQSPTIEVLDPLPESQLIPRDSLAVMTFVTDQWPQDSALVDSIKLAPVEDTPWMTDLAWGTQSALKQFSVIVSHQTTSGNPGILLIATPNDFELAQAYVQDGLERQRSQGAIFEQQQLRNDIEATIQINGEVGKRIITADFNDQYILFANDIAVLEAALVTYEGRDTHEGRNQSIRSQPYFQEAAQVLSNSTSFFWGYANPEVLLAEMASDGWTFDQEAVVEAIHGLKALSISAGQTPEGLLFKAQLDIDPESLWRPTSVAAGSSQMIQILPGNTLATITTHQVAQSWQDWQKRIEANALDSFRERFKTATQLDFEQDLLSWMDGEMAVALLASDRSLLQGLAIIETSQRSQADQTLQQLDAFARSKGLFVGSRTWIDQYLVIASHPELLTLITKTPDAVISNTEPLQTLVSTLETPNYGYTLLNFQAVVGGLFEAKVPQELDPNTRRAMNSISALGLTHYPIDTDSYGIELLVVSSAAPESEQ